MQKTSKVASMTSSLLDKNAFNYDIHKDLPFIQCIVFRCMLGTSKPYELALQNESCLFPQILPNTSTGRTGKKKKKKKKRNSLHQKLGTWL